MFNPRSIQGLAGGFVQSSFSTAPAPAPSTGITSFQRVDTTGVTAFSTTGVVKAPAPAPTTTTTTTAPTTRTVAPDPTKAGKDIDVNALFAPKEESKRPSASDLSKPTAADIAKEIKVTVNNTTPAVAPPVVIPQPQFQPMVAPVQPQAGQIPPWVLWAAGGTVAALGLTVVFLLLSDSGVAGVEGGQNSDAIWGYDLEAFLKEEGSEEPPADDVGEGNADIEYKMESEQ